VAERRARPGAGGDPSEVLLTDRPIIACVVLWALTVVLVLYGPLR
jgi:hypothetical protein